MIRSVNIVGAQYNGMISGIFFYTFFAKRSWQVVIISRL